MGKKLRVAVISSHTPSLFWFRMDMMRDFIKQGYEVVAIGPDEENQWSEKFKDNNIEYKSIFVERNGVNPFKDIKTYKSIKSILKQIKPDKIFVYQAKTIIYGSIASKALGIKEVYPLIAGLGSVFRGEGLKNSVIKKIMIIEYKVACKNSKYVFFQNHDDINEFLKNKIIPKEKVKIINGSGVSLDKFKEAPLPNKPAFLYIGRLIKDKGLMEYLSACKIIKKKYPEVRCLLVGPFDSNPSAIKKEELKEYIDDNIVEYFGEQSDVRPFIEQCSTYVLPSYHEGTPKTVLESMAMGRAIITTDAPGCRETVNNEENGFLVPVKNVEKIVDKMELLINDRKLNEKMGKESLKIATVKYDVKLVNKSIMETMNLV